MANARRIRPDATVLGVTVQPMISRKNAREICIAGIADDGTFRRDHVRLDRGAAMSEHDNGAKGPSSAMPAINSYAFLRTIIGGDGDAEDGASGRSALHLHHFRRGLADRGASTRLSLTPFTSDLCVISRENIFTATAGVG